MDWMLKATIEKIPIIGTGLAEYITGIETGKRMTLDRFVHHLTKTLIYGILVYLAGCIVLVGDNNTIDGRADVPTDNKLIEINIADTIK